MDDKYGQLKRRLQALHKLDIFLDLDPDNRADLDEMHEERFVLLELDGGGFHIVWTVQLLKELEAVAGLPAYDLFDITTGASAGAVTSCLIGYKQTAEEIEKFWFDTAPEILFPYANPLEGIPLEWMTKLGLNGLAYLTRLGLIFWNGPLYSKTKSRKFAREMFGNDTLADMVKYSGCGVLLATIDTESGYLNPFGCVPVPDEPNPATYLNSCDLLVRGAFEAAGSPPTITQPFGSFIDAGFGIYDNPIEMVLDNLMGSQRRFFMPVPEPDHEGEKRFRKKYVEIKPKYFVNNDDPDQKNNPKKVAIISLGTAYMPNELVPPSVAQNPLVPGVLWGTYFVYNVYVNAAYSQNTFLAQQRLMPWLDFRRFNMDFNASVLKDERQLGPYDTAFPKIPGIRARSTKDVTSNDMYWMSWLLESAYSPFYKAVGQSCLKFMRNRARAAGYPDNPFYEGLGNLLSRFRPNLFIPETERKARRVYETHLAETLGSPTWIDKQPTERPLSNYFLRPLPTFSPPFFQILPPYKFSDIEDRGVHAMPHSHFREEAEDAAGGHGPASHG